MSRKALLVAPLFVLMVTALFAGETILYPVSKLEPRKTAEAQRGPEAYLYPGEVPDERFEPESPPVTMGWGTDIWQYIDAEDTWLGNYYYWGIAEGLEFYNDIYKSVVVKEIEYNLVYRGSYYGYPLGGHIWEETSDVSYQPTGYKYPYIPYWVSPRPGPGPYLANGVAHRNFGISGNPTYADFWWDNPDSRPFLTGEHFFVGWECQGGWYRGNYQGWSYTPTWNGLSWYWNTGFWYKIIEQPGAPFEGCLTHAVLINFERYDLDAACVRIISPDDDGLIMSGECIAPQGEVQNNGQLTADFDVTLTIEPGGYSSTRHTSSLNMGDTEVLTFDDWCASEDCGMEYTVRLCTELAGDEFAQNDCCENAIVAFSFVMDFEEEDGLWSSDPPGKWQWGIPMSPAGAHSGQKAWATNLTGNYDNNACWHLNSWKFVCQPGPSKCFAYWHQHSIESNYDGYNVRLSTDMGASWMLIYPDPTKGADYNETTYGYCCIPNQRAFGGTSGWRPVFFDITSFVNDGDTVMIRLTLGSDGSVQYPGVVIDDFLGICLSPLMPQPDLDIDDNDGDLAANTMHLIGPPGAVVVGEFNVVNPEEEIKGVPIAECPNVDYYDGPSMSGINPLSFTFPSTLVSVGGGHTFDPFSYGYKDVESAEDQPDALALCQSRRLALAVGIPHPTTPNKVYEGTVIAQGQGKSMWGQAGLIDEDKFLLRVEVVPVGKGAINGFWGNSEVDGNLLAWNGLAFGQEGYNLYRSEEGSFVRLNGSLLDQSTYLDRDVVEGQTYDYKLGVPLSNGKEILFGPITVGRDMTPACYALHQNFPNPIRHETVIRYAVASNAQVSLRIYNITGQVVKTLVNEQKSPGYYSVSWKPGDVANGVYFYRLTAGDFSQTRKLMVLK